MPRDLKLNELRTVPCYLREENPHSGHRTEREDGWQEGNMGIVLRACNDCRVMYAVEFFNGR